MKENNILATVCLCTRPEAHQKSKTYYKKSIQKFQHEFRNLNGTNSLAYLDLSHLRQQLMANWRFPFVVKFLTCPVNNGLKQGRLDSRPLEDIIQLQISVFLYQIARKPNFFKQSVRTNVLRTLDHECCSVWNSLFRWMLANQKPRKQPLLRAGRHSPSVPWCPWNDNKMSARWLWLSYVLRDICVLPIL